MVEVKGYNISGHEETLTLLGTSANLVVDGLPRRSKFFPVEKGGSVGVTRMFGVAPAGSVYPIAGVVYMAIFLEFYFTSK